MQKLAVFHLIPKHSLNINLLCIFFMNYFAPFKGIWIPKSGKFVACGIRNQGNFCLWNPGSWALESGIQLKKSRIPLTMIGIQNPSSSDKD